jgi:hypothetical protein
MAYATEAARIHCITVAIAERNFLVVAAEGIPSVHQETCKRVTQIMEPNIGQTCATPDAVPGIEQRCERVAREWRREDVLAGLPTLKRLQKRHGCLTKCNRSGSPGFRHRHQQGVPLPVDVLPFCLGNFVTPRL